MRDELFLLLGADLVAFRDQHRRVHDPPLGLVRRDDDRLVHDAQRIRPGFGERQRAIVDEQYPGMAFVGLRQFRDVTAQQFLALPVHRVEVVQELLRRDAQVEGGTSEVGQEQPADDPRRLVAQDQHGLFGSAVQVELRRLLLVEACHRPKDERPAAIDGC